MNEWITSNRDKIPGLVSVKLENDVSEALNSLENLFTQIETKFSGLDARVSSIESDLNNYLLVSTFNEVIDTVEYVVGETTKITEPTVPAKEHYSGVWESYTLGSTDIVVNAVRSVFQTYVESLKASGSFNAEAQLIALNKAKDIALEQMTDEVKEFISKNYGSVDAWLTTTIESTINLIKNKK